MNSANQSQFHAFLQLQNYSPGTIAAYLGAIENHFDLPETDDPSILLSYIDSTICQKRGVLTESGFTDCGNPEWEQRYAGYNVKMLEIARRLPYVRTLHNFRLLNENAMLRRAGIEQNQIGGLTEVYFGLFTDPEEGCQPRARALAIQQMTGSTADLAAIGRRLTGGH